MSIDVMSKILRTSKLLGMERFTLVVLADVGNADGTSIYISRLTIAKRSGQSVASVRRRLEYLKAAGVLSWVSSGHKNKNGQDTNEYQINVQCIGNEDVINAKRLDKETRFNVEPSSTLNLVVGSTLNLPLGSTLNHNPSSDSSINQEGAAAPCADKPAAIITARVSDPLTHAFDRNVKQLDPLKIINAWRGSIEATDMCCMFVEVFGAEVQRDDKGKWLTGAARLVELNTTKAELVAVRDTVARQGGALTHPGAAYEWVKGVRARTKNKPTAAVSIPAPAGTRYVAVPAKAVQYDD